VAGFTLCGVFGAVGLGVLWLTRSPARATLAGGAPILPTVPRDPQA
jgi:hypothetical protein